MSKLSQRRIKVGYVTNVPRCATCKHYKEPYIFMKTNSETGRSHPMCKLEFFDVRPSAICSKWEKQLTEGRE